MGCEYRDRRDAGETQEMRMKTKGGMLTSSHARALEYGIALRRQVIRQEFRVGVTKTKKTNKSYMKKGVKGMGEEKGTWATEWSRSQWPIAGSRAMRIDKPRSGSAIRLAVVRGNRDTGRRQLRAGCWGAMIGRSRRNMGAMREDEANEAKGASTGEEAANGNSKLHTDRTSHRWWVNQMLAVRPDK